MRKDLLYRLILRSPGERAALVREFLAKEKMFVLDGEDISFADFVAFLFKTYEKTWESLRSIVPPTLFHYFDIEIETEQKSIPKEASGSQLFSAWMGVEFIEYKMVKVEALEERKKQNRWMLVYFDCLGHDTFPHRWLPFLDDSSLFSWLATCKTFYEATKKVDYWKGRLIQCEVERALLEEVIEKNVIRNYRPLYRSLVRRKAERALYLWQLFCWSGAPQAIDYAEKEGLITAETRSDGDGNPPLFLVIDSGSIAGIERVRDSKVLSLNHKDTIEETALQRAAWNGRVDVFDWLVALNVLSLSKESFFRDKLLRFAVRSGEAAMLERILQLFPDDGVGFDFDVSEPVHGGLTLFQYAVLHSSEEVIRALAARFPKAIEETWGDHYAPVICLALRRSLKIFETVLELGANPFWMDDCNRTVLHYAAYYNSSLAIIDRLIAMRSMDLLAEDVFGLTVFHFVVRFVVRYKLDLQTIDYFRVLFRAKVGFEFDPATLNYSEQDIFHYAVQLSDLEEKSQNEQEQKRLQQERLQQVKAAFERPIEEVIKNTKPVPKKKFNPKGVAEYKSYRCSSYKMAPDEIVDRLFLGYHEGDDIYLKKLIDEKQSSRCNFALLRCTDRSFPLKVNTEGLAENLFLSLRIDDTILYSAELYMSWRIDADTFVSTMKNRHFDTSFDFIEQALKNGKVVVVYCGRRIFAPVIIAAYLMRKYNCEVGTAIHYVEGQSNHSIKIPKSALENYKKELERRKEKGKKFLQQQEPEKKLEENPEESPAENHASPAEAPEAKPENPTSAAIDASQQVRAGLSLSGDLLAEAIRLHACYKNIAVIMMVVGTVAMLVGVLLALFAPFPTFVGSTMAVGGLAFSASGLGLFKYADGRLRASAVVAMDAAPRL